jgi:hypothetical protein
MIMVRAAMVHNFIVVHSTAVVADPALPKWMIAAAARTVTIVLLEQSFVLILSPEARTLFVEKSKMIPNASLYRILSARTIYNLIPLLQSLMTQRMKLPGNRPLLQPLMTESMKLPRDSMG